MRRLNADNTVKKYRVLVLVHKDLVPKEDVGKADVSPEWRMEWDVVTTLRKQGHELLVIGVHDDLTPIRQAVDEFKPTIAFNLMEAFADIGVFDQNVVSYLELIRVRLFERSEELECPPGLAGVDQQRSELPAGHGEIGVVGRDGAFELFLPFFHTAEAEELLRPLERE